MNNQNGIAVLSVVILTSTLIIIGMLMWHITQLDHSLLSKRTDRHKIECLTEGLLNYGIAHIIENDPKDSDTMIITLWPPGNNYYNGEIEYLFENSTYYIEAILKYKMHNVCVLKCSLSPLENGQYYISGWKMSK